MKRLLVPLIAVSISTLALADGVVSKKGHSNSNRDNEPGFYAGAGLGGFIANEFKDIENSYVKSNPKMSLPVFNILTGYKYNKYFRADINGQYRDFKYSATEDDSNVEQKIKNYSLFLNGYVDVLTDTMFTPYVTAGLGFAKNDPDSLTVRDTMLPGFNYDAKGKQTNNFAWNIGAGSRVNIYENLDLDISYRYVDLGKIEVDSTSTKKDVAISAASQDLRTHQGLLSLIYNF